MAARRTTLPVLNLHEVTFECIYGRGCDGICCQNGRPPVSAEEKERGLVELLEALRPGTWMIVEHPALDTPEMRSIGHKGYEDVAADRDGVTRAFTSDRVKEVIARRKIKLISYAEVGP